jgi:hypothetical protein
MAMAVPVPATGTALLCPDEPTAGQIVDDGSVESARPNLVTPQETSCSVSKSAIERDRTERLQFLPWRAAPSRCQKI